MPAYCLFFPAAALFLSHQALSILPILSAKYFRGLQSKTNIVIICRGLERYFYVQGLNSVMSCSCFTLLTARSPAPFMPKETVSTSIFSQLFPHRTLH